MNSKRQLKKTEPSNPDLKKIDTMDEIDEYLAFITNGKEKKESMMERARMISLNLTALKHSLESSFKDLSCVIKENESDDDYGISFYLTKTDFSFRFIEITLDMDDEEGVITIFSEKSGFSSMKEMTSIIGMEIQKPKFWKIVNKISEMK